MIDEALTVGLPRVGRMAAKRDQPGPRLVEGP